MEAAYTPEMVVNLYQTTRPFNQKTAIFYEIAFLNKLQYLIGPSRNSKKSNTISSLLAISTEGSSCASKLRATPTGSPDASLMRKLRFFRTRGSHILSVRSL
ncbi:hypothetical protein L798_02054 [Zootermopsis nevadensis]|uniref:Uncharacterized protein n=1 Tax=Zootermopsis nevadensis TaxID=136037 RepID=A0A067RE06_ZOONE|nr:hypothetical protein L798_02054 [Zootermopsis nevadensis]